MLAMAVAELASISERRVDRMLDPAFSRGLPPFLAPAAGTNSGFMLAQYTAASLVSENKVLAHPASVDTIPTSGKQEDHVSMGWTAVRKLREVVSNVRACLAVEICCAAQGIDLIVATAGGRVVGPAYKVGGEAPWQRVARIAPLPCTGQRSSPGPERLQGRWCDDARGSTHCLTADANPSCSLLAATNWARALTSCSALPMAIAKAEVSNMAMSLRPSPMAAMACCGIDSDRERARTT